MFMYINEVRKLEKELPSLVDDWKDEQDPRIPDQNAWVPEEEAEERRAIIEKAKLERRSAIMLFINGHLTWFRKFRRGRIIAMFAILLSMCAYKWMHIMCLSGRFQVEDHQDLCEENWCTPYDVFFCHLLPGSINPENVLDVWMWQEISMGAIFCGKIYVSGQAN